MHQPKSFQGKQDWKLGLKKGCKMIGCWTIVDPIWCPCLEYLHGSSSKRWCTNASSIKFPRWHVRQKPEPLMILKISPPQQALRVNLDSVCRVEIWWVFKKTKPAAAFLLFERKSNLNPFYEWWSVHCSCIFASYIELILMFWCMKPLAVNALKVRVCPQSLTQFSSKVQRTYNPRSRCTRLSFGGPPPSSLCSWSHAGQKQTFSLISTTFFVSTF